MTPPTAVGARGRRHRLRRRHRQGDGGGGGRRRLSHLVMYVTLAFVSMLAMRQGWSVVSFVVRWRRKRRRRDGGGGGGPLRRRTAKVNEDDYERARSEAVRALIERLGPPSSSAVAAAGGVGSGGGACPLLPAASASSSSSTAATTTTLLTDLWSSHLPTVLSASRHLDDPSYQHKRWTESLLGALPPSAFRRAVLGLVGAPDASTAAKQGQRQRQQPQSQPQHTQQQLHHHHRSIRRVLTVLSNRLADPTRRPLRIIVVGGSDAEGLGCVASDSSAVSIPVGSNMANPSYCAFPYRFESFVNRWLLGVDDNAADEGGSSSSSSKAKATTKAKKVVEVVNLSESGTDLAFVSPLIEYGMYPPTLFANDGNDGDGGGIGRGPDVVVDAYRTGDTGGRDGINAFVAAVRKGGRWHSRRRRCGQSGAVDEMHKLGEGGEGDEGDPPLIVRLDDAPSTSSDVDDHGAVLAIKYDDIVRRVARAEREAREASSAGADGGAAVVAGDAYRGDDRAAPPPPLGMAGHVALSWLLAFGLADASLQHCWAFRTESDETKALGPSPYRRFPAAAAKEEDKGKGAVEKEEDVVGCTGDDDDSDAGLSRPCVFAWFAGPKGTVSRPSQIAAYVRPYIVENTGWQAASDMSTGFVRKSGLVASINATIAFEFRNVSRPVRHLHLMTLKSRGAEWRDGTARFSLIVHPKEGGNAGAGAGVANEKAEASNERSNMDAYEASFEISGGHDAPDHRTYHFGLDLGGGGLGDGDGSGGEAGGGTVSAGSDVMLRIQLVSGSKFKILGIMLCS